MVLPGTGDSRAEEVTDPGLGGGGRHGVELAGGHQGWFNSTLPLVNVEEVAKKAYDTWDLYGGRALGFWGAPYTTEAWVEVVKVVLAQEREEGSDGTT